MKKPGMLLLFTLVCAVTASAQDTILFNDPPQTPQLLAPGIINTSMGERDFALSPDGTELFYTLQAGQGLFQTLIRRTYLGNGTWTAPEIAPFAGNYSDLEPAFTADGNRLYFSSNRPSTGREPKDFDIWYVDKTNGIWGQPQNAGSAINTAADEFFPSVVKDGSLYFTANYKTGIGKEDIYRAQWKNNGFEKPIALDTAVNSISWEFNAFVSPTEDFIIFSSFGRKDEKGGGDLYISRKNKYGKWQPAQNLEELNSPRLDYSPFVNPSGNILFFTSEQTVIQPTYLPGPVTYRQLRADVNSYKNGTGNIYWMDFSKLKE